MCASGTAAVTLVRNDHFLSAERREVALRVRDVGRRPVIGEREECDECRQCRRRTGRSPLSKPVDRRGRKQREQHDHGTEHLVAKGLRVHEEAAVVRRRPVHHVTSVADDANVLAEARRPCRSRHTRYATKRIARTMPPARVPEGQPVERGPDHRARRLRTSRGRRAVRRWAIQSRERVGKPPDHPGSRKAPARRANDHGRPVCTESGRHTWRRRVHRRRQSRAQR